MEEKNIGLCVWKNFYKTIKILPKKEQQGLALAILDYAFSGETEELSLMQKLALEPMKPSLKVRSFGGAPKGNSNAKKTTVDTTVDSKQNNSYSTVDTTLKSTVKTNKQIHIQEHIQEKENNIKEKVASNDASVRDNLKPKKSIFEKPTLNELCDEYYVRTGEKHSDAECVKFAEKFLAHYESVGWKVGKNPMKDWRACVRTWIHNEENFG